MAANFVPYSHFGALLAKAGLHWQTDTVNAALVTSAYALNLAHTAWANVSANELAAGGGYAAGGIALANKAVTNAMLDADDPVFPALTNKQFRYVVLYKLGTGGDLTNPLLGCLDYGDTLTVNGTTFTVRIPSAGVLTIAVNAG